MKDLVQSVGTGKSKYTISNYDKYPILGSRNIIGYDTSYDYSGDFILTARVGEYAGELYRYRGKVKITDNTVYLQGDNLDYLFYLLKKFNLKKLSFGSGQPLVKASELSNLNLIVSNNKKESKAIANLMTNIDNLITLHQRKFNDILVYKLSTKFLFLKLAKNVWEQRKLGDITKTYSGGTPLVSMQSYYGGKIPFIRSGEIHNNKTELFLTDEGLNNSSAKMVYKGNILYALYGATSGEADISLINGAINQAILAIIPEKNYDSKLICNWLKKEKNNITSTFLQGGQGNLSGEIIKNLNIVTPTKYSEQERIGKLFEQIDNLITLHHRKYTYIFYSWEQRKLTDFVEFYNGQTYSPLNVQENGTLVLRSSNVQNGEISKDDSVFIDSKVVNTNNVKIGDIIVVVRNGSRNLIGKHAQIKEKMTNTVIGAFMTGIRTNNSNFVNSLLNTTIFDNEINKNMGATINQITGYMFSNMEFKIPINDEQEKIGTLFNNIDNLITLHQHKELKRRNDNNEHLRW